MKLTIGLALLLSSFVGTASTIVNHHNVQESIQKNFNKTSLQDDPRTTLVTVFGTIPNYTCKDGLPSEIDVISYLKGIVPTQYADVINDIQIDSIGSGVINFSAVQYSRAYTGSDSFNYVIPTKVSLANVFGVSLSGQEVNINNTFNYSWSSVNTFSKFLTNLKTKYSSLDINQLQLKPTTSFPTAKNNSTNLYTVWISPIANNNYYFEDSGFSVGLQFDGRTFNDFNITGGNFNVQFNSSATTSISVSNVLPTGANYTYAVNSSYGSIFSINSSGVVTCTCGSSYNQGTQLNYSVTVTAKKSQYADKSISANFIATVIKNTSTNWATINSLSNGLNQKNYCIGRGSTFSNESYALSASCSGFMTNTTITYSVPYNPNNAVILSGNAVKPNPNCNVKGAKDYTVQVTLSNPNYTNTITKDFYFTIRYGAKFVTNLTSNEGGPWNARAGSTYSESYAAWKAVDNSLTTFWSSASYPISKDQWVGIWPDTKVKFYTCGFAFRGYTESQYWGPSSTRFSVNDADPLGGSTTIFTADNLPQNNDEQFFALRDVWNLDLCGLWLNSYTSKQYSEISDFYLYEGGNL